MGRCSIVCALCLWALVAGTVQNRSVPGADPNRCDAGHFYDHGTDRCEPCKDICDNADVKGTRRACLTKCAGYAAARGCKSDEYYDDQKGRCSQCSELCRHQDGLVTTPQCRAQCPDYPVQTHLATLLTSTPITTPWKKREVPSQAVPTSTILLALLLPTALILTLVVILAIYLRGRSFAVGDLQYRPALDRDLESKGREQEVKDELLYPQAETQPGINSQLAVSGT